MESKEFIQLHQRSGDFLQRGANYFYASAEALQNLVELATSTEKHPFPEYASWLLTHVQKKDAEILVEYQPLFIDYLLINTNQSVLRNLMNVCEKLPLIEYKESEFLDRLLNILIDPVNKPALFVYAIYKLIQFTEKYPEIKREINEIIELKSQEAIPPAIRIGIRNYLLRTKHIQ